MIKSVFIKYILAFLAIITISFTILATVITSAIVQNSIEAKGISMANAANVAKMNIEANFNGSSLKSFGEFIDSVKSSLTKELSAYTALTEDSLILIADLDGNILVSNPLPSGYLEKDFISGEIMRNILNENEIGLQTLDGVFSERHFIFPMLLKSKTGEVYGVLFFCSVSAMENSFFMNQMINTIILSCLWVLAATMVIVYFITEKIISPVREMSKAAKSFALGRFDVRVSVKGGRDEISELASALNGMAASLAVNEEMQRTFLANVSHDLRTPMTSIHGFVNSILDGTIPPDKHEDYLKIVSAETSRLSKLVSSLFDITRIQAGERKFSKTNFDICETARNAVIFLEQKIEAKHLELEFSCDEDNMYVSADSVAIRQILDNLLENAIKFTPEKGLIKINISEKDKEKKIHVSVYNTGTGIPAEDIPFVFGRFYKSDRSRGLDKTGAGLGLFIVKTIIEAHGEKIWAASEYEKYCEFIFTLPKTKIS